VIEIRASQQDKPVTTDGPHDPDNTRAIAAGIDSAVRLLNYATMSRGGLVFPSDVYSVLGELSAAAGKLPQALHQMSQWIGAQVTDGAARENPHYGKHDGDARAAHAELAAALREAAATATDLAQLLGKGQSAISGLESTREA
jgi:hypothetical protein